MKMIFHSHANKTHFHRKGFVLGIILKIRGFWNSEVAYLSMKAPKKIFLRVMAAPFNPLHVTCFMQARNNLLYLVKLSKITGYRKGKFAYSN